MTAPGPQNRGSGMTRIDEADDWRAVPRTFAEPAYQAAGVPPGADEQYAIPGCRGDRRQREVAHQVRSAVHQSPPIPRSIPRRPRDRGALTRFGRRAVDDLQYHPWKPTSDSVLRL